MIEDSAQPSESPALAGVLRGFPADFHEPFYADYLDDDLQAPCSGKRGSRRDVGGSRTWSPSVVVARRVSSRAAVRSADVRELRLEQRMPHDRGGAQPPERKCTGLFRSDTPSTLRTWFTVLLGDRCSRRPSCSTVSRGRPVHGRRRLMVSWTCCLLPTSRPRTVPALPDAALRLYRASRVCARHDAGPRAADRSARAREGQAHRHRPARARPAPGRAGRDAAVPDRAAVPRRRRGARLDVRDGAADALARRLASPPQGAAPEPGRCREHVPGATHDGTAGQARWRELGSTIDLRRGAARTRSRIASSRRPTRRITACACGPATRARRTGAASRADTVPSGLDCRDGLRPRR